MSMINEYWLFSFKVTDEMIYKQKVVKLYNKSFYFYYEGSRMM